MVDGKMTANVIEPRITTVDFGEARTEWVCEGKVACPNRAFPAAIVMRSEPCKKKGRKITMVSPDPRQMLLEHMVLEMSFRELLKSLDVA